MAKKSKNVPKTVALVEQLAKLKTVKGWTNDDVREAINKHLADEIPFTRTSISQVSRWLHPHSDGWVEPRSEIILAIQQVLIQPETLVNENDPSR